MPDTPKAFQTNAELSFGTADRGDGRALFGLYAPGKKRIDLVGDFNDWEPGRDPLEADPDGFWSLEKRFDPGTYRYRYVVDGELVVCDPYAREIEWDDPPKAVLEVGQEPYRWQHDDWERQPFADLVLYEFHVGDFTPEGTYSEAIGRLDHLIDLGVNAVELMPVTQSDRNDYWGYEPAFFFAAESRYGTPDDLRRFIDELHARRIAVIFDIVLAHSSPACPLNRLYPFDDSPWYGTAIGGKNEFGFPTFDHRKPAAEAFTRSVQTFWLREFHGDGFRYDYVKNIGYRPSRGADFLVDQARSVQPRAYLIGEHLPEEPRKTNTVDFDGVWHAKASRGMKALLLERPIDEFPWENLPKIIHHMMDPLALGYERATVLVNYIESHDEHRLVFELLQAGYDEATAHRKAGLAATLLLCMPGEPMIRMGGEWGEDSDLSQDANPIHWERLDTDFGQGLFQHYRRMIQFRQDHPALRSENYEILLADRRRKLLAFHRWDDHEDRVVVTANLTGETQEVPIPFPEDGEWLELFSNVPLPVRGKTPVELEAYGAAVFTRPE